jgi:hypothetical protein
MQIRHTGMTGIPRLGKQAQISQRQHLDDFTPFPDIIPINTPTHGGIKKHQAGEQYSRSQRNEKNI